MRSTGVDGVKVAPLATRLGVTTGSFYWHFKDHRELLDALLDFWERTTTEAAIEEARRFEGPAIDRILFLMKRIMVVYLMGESTLVPNSVSSRIKLIAQKHAILTAT